ncbi:cytochrome-c peroxidase [Flavobacterium sp. ZT3R18]|uniref:cytochrome c peroxidase n=1 Tax=Flavobacterium sp. ZT3R18 TaxID=2594429 RepID=UPI00117B1649|nr:cytochrome c peroxidase [Flavobacterium sp. ZT3R18]TRX31114.1 cytochrome-c peroxidase [Flavobacterium sp. ZT3R18]
MKNIFFLFILFLLFYCSNSKSNAEQINDLYKIDLTILQKDVAQLQHLVVIDATQKELQTQFLKAHQSYKRIESISEYYFPTVSKSINGPALEEYEDDEGITVPPAGLQVIEEYLFPGYDKSTKKDVVEEMGILNANLYRLEMVSKTNDLTDSSVFDAMRLEVFRIITLGITGFDSPIALNSLAEATTSLETIEKQLVIYGEDNQNGTALKIIKEGKNYLNKNSKFNEFDRAYFIKKYLNPLSKAIYRTQLALKIPFFKESRGLRVTAQTLFDKKAFDPEAFSGFPDYKTTKEKIELGKLLFNDPILSGNNTRSCASCHNADKAFTDGLEKAVSLDGMKMVKRNTPTLSNIAFQRSFFYDSRVNYLEDQAVAVITNENEMHGSLEKSVSDLKKSKKYAADFEKAFPNKEISAFAIKNALASYIRSLSNYDARFDGYIRGEDKFNLDEIAGFNLFAGKAKCATCHFIPLTNGTVPPNFDRSESEVLGVPGKNKKIDADSGKFDLTNAEVNRYSFKTPTIRNIALTGPYMHNGIFKTLEEVINFYDLGGGQGLGFNLSNQTLPTDKLNLTPLEKKQLIAFMKTLTDKKY